MVIGESTKIEKVSPGQAKTWLDSCKYQNQRRLRRYWVDFLSDQMEKGKFQASAAQIQFCFCMENSSSFLVNGQHTLNAIVQSGITLDGLVVTRTMANTMEEVNEFYTVIDKQSKRTIGDAFHAFDVETNLGIPRESALRLGTAAVMIENNFIDRFTQGMSPSKKSSRKLLSDSEIYYLTHKWADYYKRFDDTITPCDRDIRRKLYQAGILSVALMTFMYKPIDAIAFWKQVAQDDGLKIGDPRKTLHKWMSTHGTRMTKNNIEVVRVDALPRAVAKCWSKWMEGEEIKIIMIDYNMKVEDSLFGITREEITKHYNTISS